MEDSVSQDQTRRIKKGFIGTTTLSLIWDVVEYRTKEIPMEMSC